jgi:hypothetical protein
MTEESPASIKHFGYIVGAGFSKAISSEMPVTSELNTDVLNLFKDRFPQDYKFFPVVDDIELLLTYLAEPQPWLAERQTLKNRSNFLLLSELISDVLLARQKRALTEINGNKENVWALKLIKRWYSERTTVISLNYDVLIEYLFNLSELIGKHARPYKEIYPMEISPISTRGGVGLMGGYPINSSLLLYKLHGSINWLYSGAEEFYGEQIYDIGLEDLVKHDSVLKELAGVRARYRYSVDKVPLIVPPTNHKEKFFKNEGNL